VGATWLATTTGSADRAGTADLAGAGFDDTAAIADSARINDEGAAQRATPTNPACGQKWCTWCRW
jgi:hypothetical protein